MLKERMAELEKTAEDFWNIPSETGNLLNIFIKSSGYKNILEVGTSNGYSALWIADALKSTDGKLITIEYYPERIELAQKNLDDCSLSQFVEIRQGQARAVIADVKSEDYNCNLDSAFIDLAFIDACKREYLEYFNLIHPKIKAGGLIAADNVASHRDSLQNFLNVIENHPDYQVLHFPFGGGILFAYKNVN